MAMKYIQLHIQMACFIIGSSNAPKMFAPEPKGKKPFFTEKHHLQIPREIDSSLNQWL